LIPSVFSRICPAIWHPDPNAITNNDKLPHHVLRFMASTPWHRGPSMLSHDRYSLAGCSGESKDRSREIWKFLHAGIEVKPAHSLGSTTVVVP
jgi:hypothetical protein